MKKILFFLICISIFFSYVFAGLADELNPLPKTAGDYAVSDYAKFAAKMAVGNDHITVVKPDGTVVAWGDNNNNQLNVPAGLTNVKAVAAGLYHTLALTKDGNVFAWGNVDTHNYDDEKSPIEVPSNVPQGEIKLIAAGGTMSAVVTNDNQVIVWGNNTDLSIIPPGLGNVVAIAISTNCVLTLSDIGNVIVWGDSTCTTIPDGLNGNVIAIAAGQLHWLALKNDGTVAIVGNGGQLSKCQNIKNQANVRAIAGGWQSAAALLADGSVQGWGRTAPLGLAPNGKELIPISENVKAFSYTVSGGVTTPTICAMKDDGTLVVNASSDSSQKPIPAGLNLLSMPSSNADLNSLAVAGYDLTPAFNTSTTDYTVNVPNDVTSVNITATNDDTNASLQINGTAATSSSSQAVDNLSVGDNQVDVVVTAEDGTTTKTYSITIKRAEAPKNSNADLNGLTVVSSVYSEYYNLTPPFDAATTAYTINVPNGVVSVDITATTAYANAGLKINATDATSSVSQTVYGLTVGDNQIDIEVTAEDGTVKIYTITIKQAGSFESVNADLSDLTVAGYALSPAFNPAITAYTVNVANDVTSVNITATTADSKSSLKINGNGVTSGSAWTVNNLTVGDNQVAIEITAEDGTVKTYTFTVKRSNPAVAEYEFNISNVQLLNPLNNEEIAVVMGQSGYRVQAQIDNNGAETIDGLVIIQVRYGTRATAEGGGKVLNCVGVSSGITATGSTVTSDFVLPSGLSGTAYVDVFVWNGWNAQVPLATANHNRSFTVSN